MRTYDQLDAALAKHFAWSFAWPWEVPAFEHRLRAAGASGSGAPVHALSNRPPSILPPLAPRFGSRPGTPEQNAPALASDERSLAQAEARARASCKALALAVADAWALGDADASLLATKRLLARADRLGTEIVEMAHMPADALRLLRLFVRHSAKMTRRQRERAAAVVSLVPFAPFVSPAPIEQSDMTDLIVEVAVAGDRTLAAALLADEEWKPIALDGARLVVLLADVIDSGPTHASRAVAIDFLSRIEGRRDAVLPLRRALSLPSFSVRARALHALASASPPAATAADVVQILRDLVSHPPPDIVDDDEQGDDERLLADAVIMTLGQVNAPEAEEVLLDLIDAEHETLWLDAGWATEALAVAFPETAAAMVDHWLKCARGYERTRALGALERLPDLLAEPRLRLAVADPSFAVREAARRQWLERFQRACPVRASDLPGADLLAGPPSERFLSRLSVMHGRVRQARLAMGRALLAEAPDPEALVLLLQLVGDDTDSGEPSFSARERPREPDAPDAATDDGVPTADGARVHPAWAPTLVDRFGVLGVQGLCALAAHFPEPESFGWMRRLGDLLERKAIAGDAAAPLRALAARHLGADDTLRVDDAMRILARLGAPLDLFDRVLAVALEEDFGASDARALLLRWPDRNVDSRLASEMALALAERHWPRLRAVSSIALERAAPAAYVIAQRVLEVAEGVPEAIDAAVECARRLRAAKILDDEWALAALAHPDRPTFAVAARAWLGNATVRPALERALRSGARGGASAVCAAMALLQSEPPMSPRDRRLVAVLEGAEEPERAELVLALCTRGAPIGLVGPYLERLVVSADARVTGSLLGVGVWLRAPKARALLRALLPRIVDQELRADLEEALGTVQAPYWAEG